MEQRHVGEAVDADALVEFHLEGEGFAACAECDQARGRGKEGEVLHHAARLIGAVGSGLRGNRLKGMIMGVLLA